MTLNLIEEIPVSHPSKEGSLQAAKWMYLRMLIDPSELRAFFDSIAPMFLVNISSVCLKEQLVISLEEFFYLYEEYINSLKKGITGSVKTKIQQGSWGLSKTLSPFYLMQFQDERFLAKLKTPVIRIKHFDFHHIPEQNAFIFTHHKEHSIPWGLECSFPQFYQDPVTHLPVEILKNHEDPNTRVFKSMQKWVRDSTLPVPFMVEGHKKVVPFRLGKKCFEWINLYPELRNRGLKLYEHRSDYDR